MAFRNFGDSLSIGFCPNIPFISIAAFSYGYKADENFIIDVIESYFIKYEYLFKLPH